MQGKIIRGIAGFYYVHVADKGVYECKAKGVFRKNNEKAFLEKGFWISKNFCRPQTPFGAKEGYRTAHGKKKRPLDIFQEVFCFRRRQILYMSSRHHSRRKRSFRPIKVFEESRETFFKKFLL